MENTAMTFLIMLKKSAADALKTASKKKKKKIRNSKAAKATGDLIGYIIKKS